MRRVFSALKYDMKFQWRHGFYYVYFVIVLLYSLLLRVFIPAYRETLAVFLVFSDTSVLGFFFIGGIILLEKSQNTFESLFVTPLRIREYIAAKLISLTLIALTMSCAVMLFGYGITVFLPPVILGVGLSSLFFTLLGIIFASRVRSLNGYFGYSMGIVMFAVLPLLEFLGIYSSPFFLLFPTQPVLMLLSAAFSPISLPELLYAVCALLAWNVAAWVWAMRWFRKYVLVQIGEEQWNIV